MDLDALYRIEVMKGSSDKWELHFTDRYKAFTMEHVQERIAELTQGVKDLTDKKRFPRITAVDWKFRYRKLTSKEKNNIADVLNKRDNKLTANEWDPLDIAIKGEAP